MVFVSGAVTSPIGLSGSKKPFGFGVFEMSTMFQAATPAHCTNSLVEMKKFPNSVCRARISDAGPTT